MIINTVLELQFSKLLLSIKSDYFLLDIIHNLNDVVMGQSG